MAVVADEDGDLAALGLVGDLAEVVAGKRDAALGCLDVPAVGDRLARGAGCGGRAGDGGGLARAEQLEFGTFLGPKRLTPVKVAP